MFVYLGYLIETQKYRVKSLPFANQTRGKSMARNALLYGLTVDSIVQELG